MKKIATFLLVTMIIAIVIVVIAVINIFSRPKAEIKYTTPYGLNFENKQAIYNSTGAVDYYVSINDNEGDRHLSAIYSFDLKAGSDFTNAEIIEREDTLIFPWPSVKADQNDLKSSLIINEKGKFDWNDELQPIKTALEKMSKDYARTTLTQNSAEALKNYLEVVDTSHIVDFYADNSYVPKKIFTQTSYGMDIKYYPDILSNDLIPHQDTCFTRWGLSFYDRKVEKDIFRISFLDRRDCSYSEFSDGAKEIMNFSVQITDPFDPTGRMIVSGRDMSIAIINGFRFVADWWDPDINQTQYLPDMLYLLSCMSLSQSSSFSRSYQNWTISYDNSIIHINRGQFTAAKNDLEEMSRLQNGYLSEDEKYLSGLLKTLIGNSVFVRTNNLDFNAIVEGYYDITFNDGIGFINSQSNRISFLKSIHSIGDETITTLSSSIEKYFLKNCNCSYQEQNEYANDFIEKGDAIDKQLVLKMSDDVFHKYMKSVMFHSVKEVNGKNFENNFLDNVLKTSSYSDKIMLVKDCSEVDDKIIEATSYGKSDNQILNELNKKGLSLDDNSPIVILLYTVKRSGFMRGLDRDAVVFTPTHLYHVPNYDGHTGDISQSFTYEKLDIGNQAVLVNQKDKFNIEAIYAVEMCREIKRAYLASDNNNNEREVKNALGNYIIRTVNDHLTTVPYNGTPITYTFE